MAARVGGKRRCRDCRRWLTDPASVALGVGPTCRPDLHRQLAVLSRQPRTGRPVAVPAGSVRLAVDDGVQLDLLDLLEAP